MPAFIEIGVLPILHNNSSPCRTAQQTDRLVGIMSCAGMLDPEGETIQRALMHLGYAVKSAHAAKRLLIELEADDTDDATGMVDEMCRKMLANPVIHNYSIVIR